MKRTCKKCGNNNISVRYFEKGLNLLYFANSVTLTYTSRFGKDDLKTNSEYLDCNCKECGYRWDEDCLDTKENK